MKRRTFIGSLFAGIGAVCFPWKRKRSPPPRKSLEEIKQEVVRDYILNHEISHRTTLAVGLAFPLVRRVFPSRVLPNLIQVERIPDGDHAIPFYEP